MREIKFRSWHKEHKYMKYDVQLTKPDYGEWNCFAYYLKNDNFILMQYTGLNDKNGKEIYEGDVIEIGEPFLHFPVKQYIIKSLQELFERKGYEENEMIEDWSDCKIIGNIYENPELGAK